MLLLTRNTILAIGCLGSIPMFAFGLPALLMGLR